MGALYVWALYVSTLCVTTLWEHSMCDHSMWALYVWALYVSTLYVSSLCVTTLCEHCMCDHSMWALYVWPLYVWAFYVSTLWEHSICELCMCDLAERRKVQVLGPDADTTTPPPQKHQKQGDGARKRPCVFDDVSTVLFAGFAKKPMRFAIHSCGNVNVMTWIPCKGYRPKSIISTFAAFLLHFSKIASAKLRCVTLPHRSPKLLYKLCLQSRRHIHA